MAEQITLEEQEKILILADALLSEDETWRKGTWKCPITERDENGRAVLDGYGRAKQKTDANGRPVYQYCIEGAINQATHDVLGPERAQKVGAVKIHNDKVISWEGSGDGRKSPTARMGLDKVALELYGEEMGYTPQVVKQTLTGNPQGIAMQYNDGVGDYQGVKNIIRTGLSRVQERLAKRRSR